MSRAAHVLACLASFAVCYALVSVFGPYVIPGV